MSNTLIQIKRSTSTTVPSALATGELAFTSNGDSLWIGSPSGSNTANVVHIGSKVSYIGNSTQIGALSTGSNTELASTYAIKQFVDGKLGAFSTTLGGLTDVDVASKANNDLIVYDAASGKWENHTISGTSEQTNVSFSGQNIVVGLANNVTISGNVTVNGGITNVIGEAVFSNVVTIHLGGNPHLLNNPSLQVTQDVDDYVQLSIQNDSAGVNASADFVSYMNNAENNGSTGFIDMGATSNGYDQAAYSITQPNEGYLFASAPYGEGTSGSLVLATDSTGTNNEIKFFVGGFTYNSYQPHMVLTGSRNLGINNAAPTDRLSVGGSAWFDGDIKANGIVPLANVSYNLGNTSNWYEEGFIQQINSSNAYFDTVSGTIQTAEQPNITSLGTLQGLTVDTATSLNGNVALGTGAGDKITFNGSVVNSIVPSANVTYDLGSANYQFDKVYAANAYFTNALINGDLTVQGTLTTIDTINLTIKDPLMSLADQQANSSLFTDAVDIGFFGQYGNTSTKVYTGLARHALSNTFVLFDGLTNQLPNNVVNTAAVSIATLNAYLQSGGLSTNGTSVTITANSTLSVAITANTLSLSTALGVGSGGTGRLSLSNNYVMVGNNGGAVTLVGSSTEGHVFQINSSGAPTFGGLDGGTF